LCSDFTAFTAHIDLFYCDDYNHFKEWSEVTTMERLGPPRDQLDLVLGHGLRSKQYILLRAALKIT
jgi:hypothetical protein